MIQIIQPTRCNSFTSLLLDVSVWLNMFRASPRPSSGAYDCTRSLWFNRWRAAAGAAALQRLNQRLLVQSYAPDDGRGDARNMLSHTETSSNKLVKLLHLVVWIIWIKVITNLWHSNYLAQIFFFATAFLLKNKKKPTGIFYGYY